MTDAKSQSTRLGILCRYSKPKYECLFTFRNVTLNPKLKADLRYNTLLGLFKDALNRRHRHHHHHHLHEAVKDCSYELQYGLSLSTADSGCPKSRCPIGR
jgi:hypothetical protein